MAEAPIAPRCCWSRIQSCDPLTESGVLQIFRVRRLEPVTFSVRHTIFFAASAVGGDVAAAGLDPAFVAGAGGLASATEPKQPAMTHRETNRRRGMSILLVSFER